MSDIVDELKEAGGFAVPYGLLRILDNAATEIERLLAELETVTKSRDHYMGEFARFDKGYWEIVAERNRLFEALCKPCNFNIPCGECEACEQTKNAIKSTK